MRKFVAERKGVADVVPMRRQVRMELGIDVERQCVYIKMTGTDPCVALTADDAEARAADIMQFVHELRNGGKCT